MSKKNDHFFLGFTLGSTVAFAAALLLAPKTGAQTQEKLQDLKEKLTSTGKRYYDYAADAAEDLKAGTGEKLSDFLDRAPDIDLGDKVSAAKQPFDHVTSNLRAHFDAAREQLEEKTDRDDYDDIVIDATDPLDAQAEDAAQVQSAFQEAKAEDGVDLKAADALDPEPEVDMDDTDAEDTQTHPEA